MATSEGRTPEPEAGAARESPCSRSRATSRRTARRSREIGVESFEAKRPSDLDRAAGLIIPGGESTTLWKFFEAEPWEDAFRSLAKQGRPILGTCAGAIVLAREVTNPEQRGLDLIDIAVARNAYGRQVDSFLGEVDAPALGGAMPAVFIRAPRIRRTGPGSRSSRPTAASRCSCARATSPRRRSIPS